MRFSFQVRSASSSAWALIVLLALVTGCLTSLPVAAQGPVGWLRYAIPPDPPRYHGLPHAVVLLGNAAGDIAPEEQTAADELDRGLGHMVAGTDVVLRRFDLSQDAIILGTTDALHRAHLQRHLRGWVEKPLPEEGFRIVHLRRGIREWYILQGGSPRAELWAAFRFAALVAEDQQLPQELIETPRLALRALDMGPATTLLPLLKAAQPGSSTAEGAPTRVDVLRLLASVGLNTVIADADAEQAARLAALLRPYGIRLLLHSPANTQETMPITAGSVIRLGGDATISELQAALEQANAQARLLRRTGGILLLQGALGPSFREARRSGEPSAATAEERASVLHGELEPNIVLATEALPHDDPLLPLASPSFGLLHAAAQAAMLSVLPVRANTLAYPAPSWAALLHTPERGAHGDTTLTDLLADDAGTGTVRGGVIGMLNAAEVTHMLQKPLLHANLYVFGRLLWSPSLSPEAVTEEWARQTWGDDARAYATAARILLNSGAAAADTAAPLGMPWLMDVAGNPAPAETARLHLLSAPLADTSAIGADRTDTGTHDAGLYPEAFARVLDNPARCPPPVLLLFHRLPWRYSRLDGKPLAQFLYDSAFAGATAASNAVDAWEATLGIVDQPRYTAVHTFLVQAAMHTDIARDTTTEWLQSASGVRDALGFVGSHPGRTSVTNMQRTGFAPTSSLGALADGTTAPCPEDCTASLPFQREGNVYRITVAYRGHGGSAFSLLVNGEARSTWTAMAQDDSTQGTVAAMERFTVNGIHLQPGDTVAVRMRPDIGAGASLDFVEITRDPRWN